MPSTCLTAAADKATALRVFPALGFMEITAWLRSIFDM